jgi:hypothetical protein
MVVECTHSLEMSGSYNDTAEWLIGLFICEEDGDITEQVQKEGVPRGLSPCLITRMRLGCKWLVC